MWRTVRRGVLASSPRASATRTFGEREFVERIGNRVRIEIPDGEEMCFPLAGSRDMAIVKPLFLYRSGGGSAHVVCELLLRNARGETPIASFGMVENPSGVFYKNQFLTLANSRTGQQWVTILSLAAVLSKGTPEQTYVFELHEDGFQVVRTNIRTN